MSKKMKSRIASKTPWKFIGEFGNFSENPREKHGFAFGFAWFLRCVLRLRFFAHSQWKTWYFTCPKCGRANVRQLTKITRIFVKMQENLLRMDNCPLRDRPRFGLSKKQVFLVLWAKNGSRESPLKNLGNSKANLVIFSENPRKSMDSPLKNQGFWEAFCDFHFLLIAQGKLDIPRVQNEVNCAGNSCPFDWTFRFFH